MIQNTMSVYYHNEDFNRGTSKIYGRVSANGQFLKGLMKYGRRKSLSVYVKDDPQYQLFLNQFPNENTAPTQAIFHGDIPALHKAGLHFNSDPLLSKLAWARSYLHPTAFSLCGITHSISALEIQNEIGQMLISPIHPWDALICTSRAVKTTITELFRQWIDYFANQKQFKTNIPLQLPIIPLGIHTHEAAPLQNKPQLRKQFRDAHQINENDFVVLFFGRLFFYDKAHPVPMFMALQELSNRVGKQSKIHLIQAGWFDQTEDLEKYQVAAKTFCPEINTIILSEFDNHQKAEIWSAADVFISLVDNIQESFGLTPLEAMANELPVVVSDWDGYKDTVRHGVDGFRIPSYLPPAGCGIDLSIGYTTSALKYSTYCGTAAQMTAIDVQQATDALWQLYRSPDLRHKMGAAGRERILTTFDWQQVIKLYDDLWDELSKRRLAVNPRQMKPITSIPLLADPFLTYQGFATEILQPHHQLSLSASAQETYALVHQNELAIFGAPQRLPHTSILAMLDHLTQKPSETADELIKFCVGLDQNISSGMVARTITYLIKYNILHLHNEKPHGHFNFSR